MSAAFVNEVWKEKAEKWDALVRCKDCRYSAIVDGVRCCGANKATIVPAYHFCSWGERWDA